MYKKLISICFIIGMLGPGAFAQKGLMRGHSIETALNRAYFNRAKLPSFSEGLRNRITGRLGPRAAFVAGNAVAQPAATVVSRPVRPVMKFHPRSLAQIPAEVSRVQQPANAKTAGKVPAGSGQVSRIALPARVLMEQALPSVRDFQNDNFYLSLADGLDNSFKRYQGQWKLADLGEWKHVLEKAEYIKQTWAQFPKPQGIAGELPIRVEAVLDAVEIQAWMLGHGGNFPQAETGGAETELVNKFQTWLERIAPSGEVAEDAAVRSVVRYMVSLWMVGKNTLPPGEMIDHIYSQFRAKGRVPGSSMSQIDPVENWITRELNYLVLLQENGLLAEIVPQEVTRLTVENTLLDLQERGAIYRKMIQVIPEYAHGGVQLNVPAYTASEWKNAIILWQCQNTPVQGLAVMPRAQIQGRWGLPVNFNDLTAPEQTEVLLGTYLQLYGPLDVYNLPTE